METILVGAVVLAILGLAVRSVIKNHRAGGCSSCGGGCGGCCRCSEESHR